MHQVAEVKGTRVSRTLLDELELRSERTPQPLERRTLFESAQQVVDEPVSLSHVFEEGVVEDIEANDLLDGWNDAIQTGVDEPSHAVAIVMLEERPRLGVHPLLDGRVEGNLIDTGVVQRLFLLLGREESIAQVVIRERIELSDRRDDGRHGVVGVGRKQTDAISSGGDHFTTLTV